MPNNRTSISTSVRRHFVDNFFFSNSHFIRKDTQVADVGGKRANKRGLFNIDNYGAKVTYINIEPSTKPDILADATKIPVPDGSFDLAIIAELLEHVPEPSKVLREVNRILKPESMVLISVPFMVGVHGDPGDYGRYTETYWNMVAEREGFVVESIERQGTIFAVFGLMIQHIFRAKKRSWRPIQNSIISTLMWLDARTSAPLLTAWTTGYGVVLRKIKQ